MKFRREATLCYQIMIVCIIGAILCLATFIYMRLWLLPVCAIILVWPAWSSSKDFGEIITIDEHGISCEKAGKQLWDYDWDSIVELRKSKRFRTKAIDVIVYDKFGKPEPYALPGQYFLLGKTAKEAIKRYYKPRTENTGDG